MKLNWKKLFEMQAALDRHIIEDKDLDGQDLLDKKILALQVELGELAQSWSGFKFWSKDQEPRTEIYHRPPEMPDVGTYKNPLLEEYVDCLHFILSIGNDIGFTQYHLIRTVKRRESIAEMFTEVFGEVASLLTSDKQKHFTAIGTKMLIINYYAVLESILNLGEMLGFTADEVMQAYLDKNEINHQRQNTNY